MLSTNFQNVRDLFERAEIQIALTPHITCQGVQIPPSQMSDMDYERAMAKGQRAVTRVTRASKLGKQK